MTHRITRITALLAGALALCSGGTQALPITPEAQVEVKTCIGACPFGPLLPFLGDIAGSSADVDPVFAATNLSSDNGADNDTATGQGDSTYGGQLRAYAQALSAAPLTVGAENTGASTLSLWMGEFTVAGVGDVLLDMAISASATLFAGAGSSGYVDMGVQMGVITVADFEAAIALGGLAHPDIIDFFSGNAFAGFAALQPDGSSNPVTSTSGADAASVALDTTLCTTALVDCTVTASVTANPADKNIIVQGGENVLIYAAFGGNAIADLNLAGLLYMDGLNTMNVTPGANFTLVPASASEPATLLLFGAALAGVVARRRKPRTQRA